MYNGNIKSIMFKFTLDLNTSPTPIPNTNSELYKEIYLTKIKHINDIQIPQNTYICPAGLYGQFLYYNISNKNNVSGFLDNNIDRTNNYLYGTDKLTLNPDTIDYKTANILICDCPYKQEILQDLKRKHGEINIIHI